MAKEDYNPSELTEIVEIIGHVGRVMSREQMIRDELAWAGSFDPSRPHMGTLIGYRAELRYYLLQYEARVPEAIREELQRKGIINMENLQKLVSIDPRKQIEEYAIANKKS